MIPIRECDKLLERALQILLPAIPRGDGGGYRHMGALVADAALQACVSYEHIVRPRVLRILSRYPDCVTTSAVAQLTASIGVTEVLQWRHPEKIRRFSSLLCQFGDWKVETVLELRQKFQNPESRSALMGIPGIGPKTADYIALLAGCNGVAIDRHYRRFLSELGYAPSQFREARLRLVTSLDRCGMNAAEAERGLWMLLKNCTARSQAHRTGERRSHGSLVALLGNSAGNVQ